MHEHGVEKHKIESICDLLCRENIIKDEEVVRSVPPLLQFPNNCGPYDKYVTIYLVNRAYLWKGVRGAALKGAIVQGLMGGITTFVQQRKQKQELEKQIELKIKRKEREKLEEQQLIALAIVVSSLAVAAAVVVGLAPLAPAIIRFRVYF